MARTTRTTTRLGVQSLEAREVPALLGGIGDRPPTIEVPDYAGGTAETARVMNLPAMQVQTASDFLPSAGDVDVYQVTLKKGDFLVADVDPTGSAALQSTLQLLNAGGAPVMMSHAGIEPDTGVFNANPALGFYAPADGTYYLRLTTAATSYSFGRGYNLNLERVAVDTDQSAARLQATGAYHAWLNAAGDTLNITGPTGYGYSLRGTWAKTVSGSTVTYAAQGTMYLQTPVIGEIAVQVPSRTKFTVTTKAPGYAQLGEVTSIGGKFGLSLAPIADDVRERFGLDVSQLALAAGWTIKTGAQIKAAYQSYIQNDIAQLLDGVPYLVYGQAGQMKLKFGQVSVTTTDQAKTVLIADPADPFVYIGYKTYAAAGSLHGRIPFHTDVTLPSDGGLHTTQNFGHVYAAGTYQIGALPFNAYGDVTVDMDANRDGMFLGGSGNADQLFRGDLNAIDGVLRDINVGINGGVNLGYAVAGRMITVPLGEGSAFYSGPEQGVWFKGVQGTAFNPWAGTVLEKFQCGPGTAVEGYVYRDGRFSVATTSNYQFFGMNAALTVTVTDHDIKAKGEIDTPLGKADGTWTIGFDGNFHCVLPSAIDIGGDSNYIRGSASMTIDRVGSQLTMTATLDAEAKFKIPGFKATGDVTGTLKVVKGPNGTTYSGSLHFDGAVYVREPITGDWNKLGSVDVGLGLSGKKLTLKAFGHTFAMYLP